MLSRAHGPMTQAGHKYAVRQPMRLERYAAAGLPRRWSFMLTTFGMRNVYAQWCPRREIGWVAGGGCSP